MMKINEIFESLQGEGCHSGIPSVFVRFCGCNLHCSFCDTSHETGVEMTREEIASRIRGYDAPWIVLTGGEPSLWIDDEFVMFLKRKTGKKVAIETNGSLPVPGCLDWVTVSPKSGLEGGGEYGIAVSHADELKVVETGQELEWYFSLPCVGDDTVMMLQPCYSPDESECLRNRDRCVNRVLADPRWRLSVQLHRYLGIR